MATQRSVNVDGGIVFYTVGQINTLPKYARWAVFPHKKIRITREPPSNRAELITISRDELLSAIQKTQCR